MAGAACLDLEITDAVQSVAGAGVTLYHNLANRAEIAGDARFDNTGLVTLAGLADGNYSVVVESANNRSIRASFDIVGGANVNLSLNLEPATSVRASSERQACWTSGVHPVGCAFGRTSSRRGR